MCTPWTTFRICYIYLLVSKYVHHLLYQVCTPWQCLNHIMYTIYLYFLFGGGTSINPRAVLRLGEFQAKLCLRLAQRLGSGLDGSMVKTCQHSEEASRRIRTYDYIYILYMYNQIIAMTFRDQKKSAATRVLIWSSWLSEHGDNNWIVIIIILVTNVSGTAVSFPGQHKAPGGYSHSNYLR